MASMTLSASLPLPRGWPVRFARWNFAPLAALKPPETPVEYRWLTCSHQGSGINDFHSMTWGNGGRDDLELPRAGLGGISGYL